MLSREKMKCRKMISLQGRSLWDLKHLRHFQLQKHTLLKKCPKINITLLKNLLICSQETESYSPQEGYTENQGGFGTDTIIEIAEQVFEEKIKKLSQQISNFREFSAISETKFSNFENRLKKIESIIETLQIKILEKVGSYGEGLESIKKEMTMMQDSFSKTLPILAKPYMEKSAKKVSTSKKKEE